MASLGKDLAASMLGRGFNVVVGLACTPLYVHFMGIESYGLVGVMTTIATVSTLLTSGFNPSLNRELARLSADDGAAEDARDLVRTLELCVWVIAIAVGAAVFVLAPLLAHDWVTPSTLSRTTVTRAIAIIALVLTLQWPISFYAAGLYGLHRQVEAQVALSIAVAIRSFGAVLILWLASATIMAFLAWQAAITAASVAALGVLAWRWMPSAASRTRFRIASLRRVWRYVASSGGVEVGEILADQVDKLVLPYLVSLESYGLYMLAWGIGGRLQLLYGPVCMAIFPHLTRSDRIGDSQGLARTYHAGSQILAIVVFSSAIFVALFSKELLLLWTGNPLYAESGALVVTIFAGAAACYGLLFVPISLQLAVGWMKLAIWGNILRTAVVVVLVLLLVPRFGPAGAALGLFTANALLLLVMVPLMHRRLLVTELRAWWLRDIGAPFIAAAVVAVAWRYAEPAGLHVAWQLAYLSAAILTTTAAATLATAYGRRIVVRLGSKIRVGLPQKKRANAGPSYQDNT